MMTNKRDTVTLLDEVIKKSEPIVELEDPSPALPGSLAYIEVCTTYARAIAAVVWHALLRLSSS